MPGHHSAVDWWRELAPSCSAASGWPWWQRSPPPWWPGRSSETAAASPPSRTGSQPAAHWRRRQGRQPPRRPAEHGHAPWAAERYPPPSCQGCRQSGPTAPHVPAPCRSSGYRCRRRTWLAAPATSAPGADRPSPLRFRECRSRPPRGQRHG